MGNGSAVCKRQAFSLRTIPGILRFSNPLFGKLYASLRPSSAVSYTHLDVYKRQILACGRMERYYEEKMKDVDPLNLVPMDDMISFKAAGP